MATMNRNLNLEEVNSDAFMGVPYLVHQSVLQKAILIGSIVLAIGLNLLGNFLWEINMNLMIIITLIPLIVGVAFGCNYNEDLSLIKYFKLLISKPSKVYFSKPTEDLVQLRNASERIRQEEELLKRQQQKESREEQKKLLIKLLVGIVVFVILFVIIIILIRSTKKEEIHHTITAINALKKWEC